MAEEVKNKSVNKASLLTETIQRGQVLQGGFDIEEHYDSVVLTLL